VRQGFAKGFGLLNSPPSGDAVENCDGDVEMNWG
jgi:hypothetical protein